MLWRNQCHFGAGRALTSHTRLQPYGRVLPWVVRSATRLALGNYLNFVLDSGSSDVTCPQVMFCLRFILSFLKSFVGVCKPGLADILLKLLGAELPRGQDFQRFFISRATHRDWHSVKAQLSVLQNRMEK